MKLLTLSISKNLSNKDTKVAVSCAFSPPVSTKALLTDSLRTYQGNLQHNTNNTSNKNIHFEMILDVGIGEKRKETSEIKILH